MIEHVELTEWRCRKCQRLLGLAGLGLIRVSHKKAQLLIEGRDFGITAVCESCSELNLARYSAPNAGLGPRVQPVRKISTEQFDQIVRRVKGIRTPAGLNPERAAVGAVLDDLGIEVER